MSTTDACGGEYVELMDVSTERRHAVLPVRSLPARRLSSRLHGGLVAGKENDLNRRPCRASLYRDKVHRVKLDPLQPLTNPYRMSKHDQMPVRVFPLPSLAENESTEQNFTEKNETKIKWADCLTTKNRAISYDDLLMTSSHRYITRSSMKHIKAQTTNLDESNFSLSSNEEKTPELSQTLTRNKLRSSKTRRYKQRFNFGIFTKNSRNKSRSEFMLNETEKLKGYEYSRRTKAEKTNCMNNEVAKATSPVKGNLKRQRRFEDLENNNNQTMSLRDVLKNKDLCEEFRLFLSNEHSDENLDFWIICEKYRTVTATLDRSNLADIIFRQFLGSGAPREVNLDAKTQTLLDSNLRHLDQKSFIPAQDCIYKLMEEDSFRRFCWTKNPKRTKR
uniref:regulator of G-protein signaling 3-like isoform X2 n=1 Tax=Styela clava TaxID=7725 RepID=UPI00193A076A|nr:regulator of G-protein signaling 3-like isoform X2 [Styela clava]